MASGQPESRVKKALKPIKHKPQYTTLVEEPIRDYFLDTIFKPLLGVLDAFGVIPDPKYQQKQNTSGTAVITALMAGSIHYADGQFTGSFNAAISRELRELGAKKDRFKMAFNIEQRDLPIPIQQAVADSKRRGQEMYAALLALLLLIGNNIAKTPKPFTTKPEFDEINRDIAKQARTKEDFDIEFIPGRSDDIDLEFADETTQLAKIYAEEKAKEIAYQLEKARTAGAKTDQAAKIIEIHIGQAKRKARTLGDGQTSIFTAVAARTIAQRLGSTTYMWQTMEDDRVRPTPGANPDNNHRVLNKRVFRWDDPPIVDTSDGRKCNPGEDFNCLPGDAQINFAGDIKKAFRRWYDGELATVILKSGKTLRGTPNHPVLTLSGWKGLGFLDEADYVIDLGQELGQSAKLDDHKAMARIDDIFASLGKAVTTLRTHGHREQFHGDGTHSEVDIVSATRGLLFSGQSLLDQCLRKLGFTNAYESALRLGLLTSKIFNPRSGLSAKAFVGINGNSGSVLWAHFSETNDVSFRYAPDGNSVLNKHASYGRSVNAERLGDTKLTFAQRVADLYSRTIKRKLIPSRSALSGIGDKTSLSKVFGEIISTNADNLARLPDAHPFLQKGSRVVNNTRSNFSGHVYNLETGTNWYCADGVVMRNCRCWAIPIITVPDNP